MKRGDSILSSWHVLIDDYSTSRVLTMDLVHGRNVTALSPLARIEIDGEGNPAMPFGFGFRSSDGRTSGAPC